MLLTYHRKHRINVKNIQDYFYSRVVLNHYSVNF